MEQPISKNVALGQYMDTRTLGESFHGKGFSIEQEITYHGGLNHIILLKNPDMRDVAAKYEFKNNNWQLVSFGFSRGSTYEMIVVPDDSDKSPEAAVFYLAGK